ncbi:MAG: hypothetical protein PHI64_03105 [Zoogloea sp.]|uniref:hypothetical protein n=1 Tax=Zoogloea sp. TaxID=49181 RepID=UPI00261CCFB5|nr:hypothetical protein [Zoogloea sp.]MDD2987925.1 hypothetical protein [Zoogloea sp.]
MKKFIPVWGQEAGRGRFETGMSFRFKAVLGASRSGMEPFFGAGAVGDAGFLCMAVLVMALNP